MPRKKILYIITKGTWGGAQRYVWDLVRSLPKDRFEPIVACGESGQLTHLLQAERIEVRSIASLGRDIAFFDDVASFFEIAEIIREVRPDVVHINSSKAAALGALAARVNGIRKIVFTVHGWPFKEHRNLLVSTFFYLASHITALLSTDVVVVSRDDIPLGEKMWRISKKLRYIPIGIDAPDFLGREDARQTLRAVAGSSESLPDSATIIGTIAELTPNKGIAFAIDGVLDLIKHVDEHFLYVIIGEGEQRRKLQELAKRHGIENKVVFLGFVPDAGRLIRAFDIFVLPSIKEGMPYVLLEAGESGIPVVATRVANSELSDKYENIQFVAPHNALSIADGIRAAKGRAMAQDRAGRYPLSKMVDDTTALYA